MQNLEKVDERENLKFNGITDCYEESQKTTRLENQNRVID